ncbi:hypothetical protein DFH08DRAFT_826829 [Mycena albidolilacea]|uniref:Uncharacterized protein n=1 Tax=Mycena albidolilacea TaxID=1033008 RepID=A0AAD6YZH0_9AGAR|nr:hypothetical protein DFH08DRAFT_826829 [Mycena albidolilacea]
MPEEIFTKCFAVLWRPRRSSLMHLVIGPYLLFLILSQALCVGMDQTPPNTPQRARIASQRFERDNRVLDSPQCYCRHGAQAFLANFNFQHGNAAPQLTPNSVTLAQEHLAQLQHPLESCTCTCTWWQTSTARASTSTTGSGTPGSSSK